MYGGLSATFLVGTCLLVLASPVRSEDKMQQARDEQIARLTQSLQKEPDNVRLYSQRGDAYFFSVKFDKAVADYEKMVELDSKLEPYHWRRGIAYYYAGKYDKAAGQFELYHQIDDMDRENGIWRFLSQAKLMGIEKARAKLIRYSKDDRAPLPEVYRMFAGETTGAEIIKSIKAAQLDKEERNKRLFYAQLYIGLLADIDQQPEIAKPALKAAAENPWPKQGGPGYMKHCARLHLELLTNKSKQKSP